jgi:hypothetical protein
MCVITFGDQRIISKLQIRNKPLKSTVLSEAEATGTVWNTLASIGFRLRQHNQFLTFGFLLKTILRIN